MTLQRIQQVRPKKGAAGYTGRETRVVDIDIPEGGTLPKHSVAVDDTVALSDWRPLTDVDREKLKGA